MQHPEDPSSFVFFLIGRPPRRSDSLLPGRRRIDQSTGPGDLPDLKQTIASRLEAVATRAEAIASYYITVYMYIYIYDHI